MNTNNSTKLSADQRVDEVINNIGRGEFWDFEKIKQKFIEAMEEYASQQREDEGVTSVKAVEQIEKLTFQMLKENRGWRYGQALFNATYKLHPTIADKLRGGDLDCFYQDFRCDDFLRAVSNMLNVGQAVKECDATPAQSISEPLANNHLTGEEAAT